MAKDKRKKTENTLRGTRRKRVLSVIYFVDSSSTRSLKIPLEYFKAGAGLLLGITLWSLVSVFIIHSLVHTQKLQRSHIGKLSSIIFDYQTRYDGVYEEAYPISERSPTIAASSNAESIDPPTQKANVATENPKDKVQIKSAEPVPSAEEKTAESQQGDDKDEAEADAGNGEINIEVDKPTYRWDGKNLHVNFAIRNLDANHRAKGNVWAVVQLTDKQGKKSFGSQPSAIKCDAQGIAQNPTKGTSFMIKRFRPFSMVFNRAPQEVESASLIISTIDQKHNRKDHPFEIDRAVFSNVQVHNSVNEVNEDEQSVKSKSPNEEVHGDAPN